MSGSRDDFDISGSLERNTSLNKDIITELLKTAGGTTEPLPYQVISGSGYGWFLEPTTKKMERVPRGIEVVQITEKPDKKGKVLVRSEYRYLMVPADEILDVGYN